MRTTAQYLNKSNQCVCVCVLYIGARFVFFNWCGVGLSGKDNGIIK